MPLSDEEAAWADDLATGARAVEEQALREIADAATSTRPKPRLRGLLADVNRWTAQLVDGARRWISGTLPQAYQSGAAGSAASMGLRFDWTTPHREAVDVLARRVWDDVAATLQDVTPTTQRAIRSLLDDTVRRQILDGLPGPRAAAEFARAIQEQTGAMTVTYRNGARHSVSDYADTVARSAVAETRNRGVFGQARDAGVTFVECYDGADCQWGPGHSAGGLANGMLVTLEFAEDHSTSHPRCVMPDTPVTIYGDLIEMVRARYSGPSHLLRFSTSTGPHHLTIGPHHPMLTRRGWLPGHLVREGDELVYDLRHDDPGRMAHHPHLDEVPRAEDLFESVRAVGASTSVPASRDDLHGDGRFCEGEVDVVRPARRLLLEADTSGPQMAGQNMLVGTNPPLEVEAIPSSHDALLAAVAASAGGGVGRPDDSCGLVRPLLGAHPRPAVSLGLGERATDAHGSEGLAQRCAGDAETLADLVGREAFDDVQADQLVMADGVEALVRAVDPALLGSVRLDCDGLAAPVASDGRPLGEPELLAAPVGAEAPGSLDGERGLAVFAGSEGAGHRFAFVEVEAVEVGWHDGFVYDVTSTAGRFGAAGCIAMNCARGWSPRPDVRTPQAAEEARRFTPEEQEQMAAEERVRAATATVDGRPRGALAVARAQGRQPRAVRQPRAPRTARA